jgi:hypothetical protein
LISGGRNAKSVGAVIAVSFLFRACEGTREIRGMEREFL